MSIYPEQPAAAPRSRNQRTVGARFLQRLMVIFHLSVCTGEGIAQAWRSFHRFESGANLRAWLFKIMFNTHYSGRRRERLQLAPSEEGIAETIAFDPPTPQRLTEEEVIAALERLPREFQIVVALADVEELSYKEIVEALRVPIGTVMSRLRRGRKLLRMELASYALAAGYYTEESNAKSRGGSRR